MMAADIVDAGATRPKNPNKVRKRAPKACLSCRARKVRCDVSQRGRPCMNCYLDSETCVVTGRASRLRKTQRPPSGNETANNTGDSTAASTANNTAAAASSSHDSHNHSHGQAQKQQHDHQHDHDHGHGHHHHHHSVQDDANDFDDADDSFPDHLHPSPPPETGSQSRSSGHGTPIGDHEAHPLRNASAASVAASLGSAGATHNSTSQNNNIRHNHRGHGDSSSHQHQPEQRHVQPHSRASNDASAQYTGFGRPGADFMTTTPSTSWASEQGQGMTADITYSYYPFLAISNLSIILPQDVNYLELQSCLRVPTRSILDEFVQQYFLHVHPLLPLFNEGDFWELYCQQAVGSVPPAGRMSLLVFQAVLFATSNFVSRSSIRALGFPTIRLARAAFYRRAKLLYDFETESSPAAIAQAALLLSFWSPVSSAGTKNPNTAWLSTAIHQAKLAEAHHYATLPPNSRRANALKRIWWCCILRDRVIGLGVRRSIQITRAHFDLESNPPLTRADLADEIERSRVYNPGTKSCLIDILCHIIDLCVVLTDVLTLVFPLDDTPGWGRAMDDGDVGRVRQCKIELRRWYKDVALKLPMFGGNNSNSSGGGCNTRSSGGNGRLSNGNNKEFYHDSIILYTNLMYMYYHSSRVALCHHEVLHIAVANATPGLGLNGHENAKSLPGLYENRYELQDAASGVTECLKELIQLRLARWLPISAAACTALPLFLHILDAKLSSPNAAHGNSGSGTSGNGGATDGPNSASSALKQHRLNILIEAMKTYQPQYDGVDWISATIRHIINLAQLDGPPMGQPQSAANGKDSTASGGNSNGISDWTDILSSNPSWYLRLAMTMDLALSKNRMPEERDFPVGLRGLFGSGFSPIRNMLMGKGRNGNGNGNGTNSNGNSSLNANGFSDHSASSNVKNHGRDRNNNINNSRNGNKNGNASNSNGQFASTNTTHAHSSSSAAAAAAMAAAAAPGMTAAAGTSPIAFNPNFTPAPATGGLMDLDSDASTGQPGSSAALPTVPSGTLSNNNGLLGDFAGDFAPGFMLAPHHLAMSMSMAMGMDMDLAMDMDMAANMDLGMVNGFVNPPPAMSGNGALCDSAGSGIGPAGQNNGVTSATPAQLASPPSDEDCSPSSGPSGSEAGTGNSPLDCDANRAVGNDLTRHHSHLHATMLDAYTFDTAADDSPAGTCTATDMDVDEHDHETVNGFSMPKTNRVSGPVHGTDSAVDLEEEDWIKPSWDDVDAGEMHTGDRDTARALLEAMGEA